MATTLWDNLGVRKARLCYCCNRKRTIVRLQEKREWNASLIQICTVCLAQLLLNAISGAYERPRRKGEIGHADHKKK